MRWNSPSRTRNLTSFSAEDQIFVFFSQEFAGCLNLQEDQEVLDLGCGPGGSTFYLADVSNNFKERQFTTLELGSIVVLMLTC